MFSTQARDHRARAGRSVRGLVPWWFAASLAVVIVWAWVVVDKAVTSDRALRTVCDRVVEHLLTTNDPVELERSRILVSQVGCDVSRRLERWPAARTGNLTP